jgi:hypothetical protein
MQARRGPMRKLVAVLAGLVTAALLFPTSGTSGCAAGTGGGTCESWSNSILVRYPGENGAVGMGLALAAGVVVAVLVHLIAEKLLPGKE